ncbi:hypothetical protein K8Z49_43065 [Actinomadura madurae]|uniref:hypothetical protein n=1 Tax=Actinomadura madurae TaxID=1993 RepID=UPI00399B7FFA
MMALTEGRDALVPDTPHVKVNVQEVRTRNLAAREIVSNLSAAMPSIEDLWLRLYAALADVPALVSEITRLAAVLSKVRRDRANLVAAGRATLKAERDAEPDPLYYLRDELRAQGHLPPNSWGHS